MTKLDFYKTPDADFLDGLLHRTEDELNRFENLDLIEVTPTGKVNAYGYPIKNYKVKWNRLQKNRMKHRFLYLMIKRRIKNDYTRILYDTL